METRALKPFVCVCRATTSDVFAVVDVSAWLAVGFYIHMREDDLGFGDVCWQ